MKRVRVTAVQITPFCIKVLAAVRQRSFCRVVGVTVYSVSDDGEAGAPKGDVLAQALAGFPANELRVVVGRQQCLVRRASLSDRNGPFDKEDVLTFGWPDMANRERQTEETYEGVIPKTFLSVYERKDILGRFDRCRVVLSSDALAVWLTGERRILIDVDEYGSEVCCGREGRPFYSRYVPGGVRLAKAEGPGRLAQTIAQEAGDAMKPFAGSGAVLFCPKDICGPLQDALSAEGISAEYRSPFEKSAPARSTKKKKGKGLAHHPLVSFAALWGAVLEENEQRPDLTPSPWAGVCALHRLDRWTRRSAGALVGLIILGGVVGLTDVYNQTAALKLRQAELEAQQAQGKKARHEIAMFRLLRQDYNRRYSLVDVMRKIARAAGKNIFLMSLEVTDGLEIVMEGIASSPEKVGLFQREISDSPLLDNVRLDYVRRLEGTTDRRARFRLRGDVQFLHEGKAGQKSGVRSTDMR